MPELPEVEAARRRLSEWTRDRRIDAVHTPDPAVVRPKLSTRPSDATDEGAPTLATRLTGAMFQTPVRHGKRLGLRFTTVDGPAALLAHLGMTGKWVRAPEATRFARLGLRLDDGSRVWFDDARRFGCVTPVPAASLEAALADGLGPDALSHNLTGPLLVERLTGRRPIKVALLDQRVLAGLGNIHAAEALWRARLHPATPCNQLDLPELTALAAAIHLQLDEALTDLLSGEIRYLYEGAHVNRFAVYGRHGEPCPRCAAPIHRFSQSSRTTWHCPACQQMRDGSVST